MALVNDQIIAATDFTDDVRVECFNLALLVASSTKYVNLMICPIDEGMFIEAIQAVWTTAAGTSGTLSIGKVASGTAGSSATSMMTGTIDIAGTAATHTAAVLDPTKNFVPTGSRIVATVVHGGTVSENLMVQIRWRPFRPDTNLKG